MKNDYKNLKIKLLMTIAKNILLACIVGAALYVFIFKIMRNSFFYYFEGICYDLGMSMTQMQDTYFYLFKKNEQIILIVAFASIVIFFLYRAFSKVTAYINSIVDSLDTIVEDKDDVNLPEELKPVENKLNYIKKTLREKEELAKESEKRKNELVVYLAHDIKTPLTSLVGYLTLLKEEKQISEEIRQKYINITLEKSERIEDLMNEFFEITRFNLSDIKLDKTDVNISVMIGQIAEEMYPLFTDKNINYETDFCENSVISVDSDKIARVFDNIIKNAINYSYKDTTIKITTKKEENNIGITVENKGKTIPEEKIKYIFEKFYRVDGSRNSKTGGAGLGLAIAKEIVEKHNGKINVTSVDNVTKFYIELPLED